MKPSSKLSIKSKLTCLNPVHVSEEIKVICLNPECTESPLLCSLCLTEFSHEKCKYNLVTVKELGKGDLWKMDNWPTRPEHYAIKEKLRKYDDLIELDALIEEISEELRRKINRCIDELKNNAKTRYRLLIEKREYDIEPLREIFFDAYNMEKPMKIMEEVASWKKNIYQALDALEEFKKNEDRPVAMKELNDLLKNGRFPLIPTKDIMDRAYKIIIWEIENLPKEIFGEKVVTNTLEFIKQRIEDEDGTYDGETSNGKKHGTGKYFFKNGNIYEGEMHKGMMQGKGRYTWANQNVYEGTFVADKMCGFGKLIFANGDAYEGEFINNKACGEGKMISHTGEAYEGQFMNNLKQGKGKQYMKNGNMFEGEFFEGKWHGRGKIVFPDTSIEEGVWLENEKV